MSAERITRTDLTTRMKMLGNFFTNVRMRACGSGNGRSPPSPFSTEEIFERSLNIISITTSSGFLMGNFVTID